MRDKLTYAGSPANLAEFERQAGFRFIQGDICDRRLTDEPAAELEASVNFAAETHVDHSLMDPTPSPSSPPTYWARRCSARGAAAPAPGLTAGEHGRRVRARAREPAAGDGAPWIWNLATEPVPKGLQIVYLVPRPRARERPGKDGLSTGNGGGADTMVTARLDELYDGDIEPLLAVFAALLP